MHTAFGIYALLVILDFAHSGHSEVQKAHNRVQKVQCFLPVFVPSLVKHYDYVQDLVMIFLYHIS